MSFWTAIVLIVLIGSIASVLQAKYKAKHGITTDMMGNESVIPRDNGEKAALKQEVEELRERIHVLERIATDDRESKKLTAEIEQLRKKD